MNIDSVMTSKLITINPDMQVKDAAKIMCDNRISMLPVVNENSEIIGILTESDFLGKEVEIPHAMAKMKQIFGQNLSFNSLEKLYALVKEKKVGEVMTKKVKTVNSNTNMENFVEFMIDNHLKRVPVLKDNKLVGIVTRKDLIKSFL